MSRFRNIRYSMLILFASISLSSLAHADSEQPVEIRIQGNRRIESAAILNVVKMRAGDTLSGDKTDADIRAIYKLGHFQDVQAIIEQSNKGAVLVYLVQEKPIVREITLQSLFR